MPETELTRGGGHGDERLREPLNGRHVGPNGCLRGAAAIAAHAALQHLAEASAAQGPQAGGPPAVLSADVKLLGGLALLAGISLQQAQGAIRQMTVYGDDVIPGIKAARPILGPKTHILESRCLLPLKKDPSIEQD